MAMPQAVRGKQQEPGGFAPDRGCAHWSRCISCPFKACITELSPREQATFSQAWRTVLRHLTPDLAAGAAPAPKLPRGRPRSP